MWDHQSRPRKHIVCGPKFRQEVRFNWNISRDSCKKVMLPVLRMVPARILALSRTNTCPLPPSGILCTQIFSCSITSEEDLAWEKYTSDLCLQDRKHAPLTDTLEPLKLWKKTVVHTWKSTKKGMMVWQVIYFACRLTSRVGCFVVNDSNSSMAYNYSIDQLPVYLASDSWVRFWSERPVIGLRSSRQHIIPFLPNVALVTSEHILLELGRGGGQYKMTFLMDRAEFNLSNCLKSDDSWHWMWSCTGVNEDTCSYWELHVCTSGIQIFPVLNGQVQLDSDVLGPHSF